MLTDHWDIAHICIAVDDLEAAQRKYEQTYGFEEWGPLLDFSDENLQLEVASSIFEEKVSMVGLREIWSKKGSESVTTGPPFAALELAHARPFSPSFSIWGTKPGTHYIHHLCYWVDDIEAESEHLVEQGYAREITLAPGDKARGFAYHLAPDGMRVELMRREDKEPIAAWLEGGDLALDWGPDAS